MVEPIWQNSNIRLRKTTDSQALFIDVDLHMQEVMQIFMEAASTLYSVTWNPKASGWLIPADKQTLFVAFLEAVSEVFTCLFPDNTKPLLVTSVDQNEIGLIDYAGGGEARATHWLIGINTLGVLLALFDLSKYEFALGLTNGVRRAVESCSLDEDNDWPNILVEIEGFDMLAVKLFQTVLGRTSKIPALRRGDLLGYTLTTGNVGTRIYDGTNFLRLEKQGRYTVVPRQFTVPEPFPLRYWTDSLYDKDCSEDEIVWPNFSLLNAESTLIEYVVEPPELDINGQSYEGIESHYPYAALRFILPSNKTYDIYYFSPYGIKPSLEELWKDFTRASKQSPSEEQRNYYYAYDDTTLITSL